VIPGLIVALPPVDEPAGDLLGEGRLIHADA
jgi:hypothetical protein